MALWNFFLAGAFGWSQLARSDPGPWYRAPDAFWIVMTVQWFWLGVVELIAWRWRRLSPDKVQRIRATGGIAVLVTAAVAIWMAPDHRWFDVALPLILATAVGGFELWAWLKPKAE